MPNPNYLHARCATCRARQFPCLIEDVLHQSGRLRMYWLVAGLLALGAACGATIRLMIFIGVLVGAALVAFIGTGSQGAGAALLNALIAIVTLQVGYAAGLVLRAAIRSLQRRPADRATGARS